MPATRGPTVPTPIFETSINSLPLLGRGKVRDIYAVDADKLHQARIALAGQGLPKAAPSGDSLIAALPMPCDCRYRLQ